MTVEIPSHVQGFWRSFLVSGSAPRDAGERFYESFRIGIEDELSVVENGNRVAVGVVETTWVDIARFDEVDARFAYEYGEGDRTLEGWKKMFWPYYAKRCEVLGRKMAADTPLVCERFRVIFPA